MERAEWPELLAGCIAQSPVSITLCRTMWASLAVLLTARVGLAQLPQRDPADDSGVCRRTRAHVATRAAPQHAMGDTVACDWRSTSAPAAPGASARITQLTSRNARGGNGADCPFWRLEDPREFCQIKRSWHDLALPVTTTGAIEQHTLRGEPAPTGTPPCADQSRGASDANDANVPSRQDGLVEEASEF